MKVVGEGIAMEIDLVALYPEAAAYEEVLGELRTYGVARIDGGRVVRSVLAPAGYDGRTSILPMRTLAMGLEVYTLWPAGRCQNVAADLLHMLLEMPAPARADLARRLLGDSLPADPPLEAA